MRSPRAVVDPARALPLNDPALYGDRADRPRADLDDDGFDAPEARELDVIVRGLSMVIESDERMLELSGPIYDGIYEHRRRATMLWPNPG